MCHPPGCDAVQNTHKPVRHIVALRSTWACFRVIEDIQRGCPAVAVPHLFCVVCSRHDNIEISGAQALPYISAVHFALWKCGVQGKRYAVINAVEIDVRH